jgi:hypothetical protein
MDYFKAYKKYKQKYKNLLLGGSENNGDWVEVPWWNTIWQKMWFDQVGMEHIISNTIFQITDPTDSATARVARDGVAVQYTDAVAAVTTGGLVATLQPGLIGCYATWVLTEPVPGAERAPGTEIVSFALLEPGGSRATGYGTETPGLIVYNTEEGQFKRIVVECRSSGYGRMFGAGRSPIEVRLTQTYTLQEQAAVTAQQHLQDYLEEIGVITMAVPAAEQS